MLEKERHVGANVSSLSGTNGSSLTGKSGSLSLSQILKAGLKDVRSTLPIIHRRIKGLDSTMAKMERPLPKGNNLLV